MDRNLAKQIRALLIDRGAEKVRFRRGEIHAYGPQRNTNATGWYFVDYILDVEIKGIGVLDR